MLKKLLLITVWLFAIFFSGNLFGTQFAGADFTYNHIGGNTYTITLSLYHDCSGATPPTSITVAAVCDSNVSNNFSFALSKLTGTGVQITPMCPMASSTCTGGAIYGLQEYVYQNTITLPPCICWKLSLSGGERNTVSTVYGQSMSYMLLEINNMSAPNNTAPVFTIGRVPIVIKDIATQIDYGAFDPDGDSLVYSFYTPLQSNGNPVNYIGAYSASSFINSSVFILLDSNTGVLSFTPNTLMSSIFGIKVEQWKMISGVSTKVGTVYREIQIKVIPSINHPPSLSGIDITNSHIYNSSDTIFNKIVCANQQIQFDINGFDLDTNNSTSAGNIGITTMSWDNGISGATFTINGNGTNSTYGHFTWTPTNADVSTIPHCFTVSTKDGACPYNSVISKKYCLEVKAANSLNLNIDDAFICSDSSVMLIAQTSASNPVFIWKLNNDTISSQISDTFIYVGNNYLYGLDTISVLIPNQNYQVCSAVDTAFIHLIYQPTIHNTYSDTGFCVSDVLTLDAGLGSVYRWNTIYNILLGTGQTQDFYQTGTYTLFVSGDSNLTCIDRDTMYIEESIPAVVYIGNDTVLESFSVLTLDAGAGHNYLWSTGQTTQSITVTGNDLGLGNSSIWVMVYDYGCPVYDTINIEVVVGINQSTSNFACNITPNPSNGNIRLDIINSKDDQEVYTFEVYNSIGQKVFLEQIDVYGKFSKTIDLRQFGKGIYFVKIVKDKSYISSKIIIL
jgi:hypothetical protein